MTEGVVFSLCAFVGWWMAFLHTASRETVPNSIQNERYVCYNNEQRTCFQSEPVWRKENYIVMNVECVYLFDSISFCSPHITENTEGQEFLSGMEEKKTTQFTDVSSNTASWLFFIYTVHIHSFDVLTICLFLFCIGYSLRGKPHLACLSSTWAMQSWEVES